MLEDPPVLDEKTYKDFRSTLKSVLSDLKVAPKLNDTSERIKLSKCWDPWKDTSEW